MRTIAHLADLHFGRHDPVLLSAFAETLQRLQPDVVTIAGNLVHRARPRDFQAVRHFLETLPSPQIVVPGDCDLARWRLFDGLKSFRRYIASQPPVLSERELFVGGLSTRSSRFGPIGIDRRQAHWLKEQIAHAHPDSLRLLVTHHPLGESKQIREQLSQSRVDIFLTAQAKESVVDKTTNLGGGVDSALIVQAGPISLTGDSRTASFYCLRFDRPKLVVESYQWETSNNRFALLGASQFGLRAEGWQTI